MTRTEEIGKQMFIKYITAEDGITTKDIIADGRNIIGDFLKTLEEAPLPTGEFKKIYKLNKTLSGTTQVSK